MSRLIRIVEEVQRVDTDVKRLQRSIRAHEELADDKSRKLLQEAWRYAILACRSKDVFLCKAVPKEWNDLKILLQRPKRVSCSSECRNLLLMLRATPKLAVNVLLHAELSANNKLTHDLIRDLLGCVCGGLLFADDQRVGLQLLLDLLHRRIAECDSVSKVFDSHTSLFLKSYMEYLQLSVGVYSFVTGVLYTPLVNLVTEHPDYLDYDAAKASTRLSEKTKYAVLITETDQEHIKKRVGQSQQKLLHCCGELLSSFENNLTAMPPGILWLLTAAKQALLKKWPHLTESSLCGSLLDLLIGTIICPAMINPNHHGLLDGCLLNRPVRHNINQIALMLQALPRLSFTQLENSSSDSFYSMMASFDMTKYHQLSRRLMQLLSINSFPCTVLLPLAKRPFLYMTREQLDRILSSIVLMRDHPSLNANSDAQLSELIRLAIQCSEESHASSLNITPEMTPTHTPSSSPPSRRKKKQSRPSSGTKSPSKDKNLSISSISSGGIPSARNSYNKLPVFEEQSEVVPADLEVLSVPLADTWNTERVYMVEMSSEREFFRSLDSHQSKSNVEQLLLDLSVNEAANKEAGLASHAPETARAPPTINDIPELPSSHDNSDVISKDLLSHTQFCLLRALEGISLDNMSQVFGVLNHHVTDSNSLVSLDQSDKTSSRDELIAVLHHQLHWYQCSGMVGDTLLFQDLLQKLDKIPSDRTPELITMVVQQCSQREQYVNYLRKLDQQLCHHDSQMDRTQNLFNRLLELLATSVATFTVKHFLLDQEAGIKQFTVEVKKGDMMVDDKCAVVHKYIKYYSQKLLEGATWSSFSAEENDEHMAMEACQFMQHIFYSNVYRNVFYPNGVSDQSRDQIFSQHLALLSSTLDLQQVSKVYHITCPWATAQQHLKMMRFHNTPYGKALCVLRCCKTINHLLRFCLKGQPPGADDIFPVLLYVLIKANPTSLLSTIQFVDTFNFNELEGEISYWWHQFTSAVQYTKTQNANT